MKSSFGIILLIFFIATLASADTVATPTFDPDGGRFTDPGHVQTKCATSLATIRYTTNGIEPTEEDPVCTSLYGVSLSRSCTLKAKAFKYGVLPSETKSAEYTIVTRVPAFSPTGGVYAEPQKVTIYGEDHPTIYYTLDGQEPTTSSPSIPSGNRVLVDHSLTLKAVALKPGCELSPVRSAVYSFREPAIQHVRIDGSNSNDGLTWDAAKRTIQAAIYAARPGDEVWVAGGTYGTVRITDGIKLCGGFAGSETARSQRDVKVNRTILDGGDSGYLVGFISPAGSTTIIDGFTIQHGTSAIYGYGASPTIRNNVITGIHGRACIDLSDCPEPLLVENNLIIGNDADGIYCLFYSPGSGSSIIITHSPVI